MSIQPLRSVLVKRASTSDLEKLLIPTFTNETDSVPHNHRIIAIADIAF